jgi:flagellar hook-associated protein 3 FlgL
MTGITATANSYGILSTLIANSTMVHQHLDTLTEQISSGLVAQTYAGLDGNGANISLNLNLQINALQTYQKNIDQASGAMQLTQTAMTQIQQIAAKFVAAIPSLGALNSTGIDSVASDARQALSQVANLLDTKYGNSYVFAGQDSGNPPVPAPDNILSSGFYTNINTSITALSTNGAALTIKTTLDIASPSPVGTYPGGTSPFSAYLSQTASPISAPVVQTGEGSTTSTGLLASANSVAVSPGVTPATATLASPATTTGSYMRDLLRALATLGSMSSSQVNDPNFAALVQDTGASLNGIVGVMAADAGALGNTQASLTSMQTQLIATSTALTGQISDVENVDMATALSNLTATQTQLQASYRMISAATSLSLVNFLPASA